MTGHPLLTCSKAVGGVCRKPAVSLLLVRVAGETSWDAKPRCGEHPAVDDQRMLSKMSVLNESVVVPL
jgi:hypothetical protein